MKNFQLNKEKRRITENSSKASEDLKNQGKQDPMKDNLTRILYHKW